MQSTIWNSNDYKNYINSKISSEKSLSKSNLAKACQCQSAYVSQVLNAHANFSLEQIYSTSKYFNHNSHEHDFFILLFQWNRAGTVELKKYFKDQMNTLASKRLKLSNRLEIKNQLSTEEQAKYYSSWIYPATHLATTLPNLKSEADIAEMLSVPNSKISEAISFLTEIGLIDKVDGKFVSGLTTNHLSSDAPLLPLLHTNSRQLVIDRVNRLKKQDLADNIIYSSTITLSQKDFNKIKDILIETIKKSKSIIHDSEEEIMAVFNLDFIQLK